MAEGAGELVSCFLVSEPGVWGVRFSLLVEAELSLVEESKFLGKVGALFVRKDEFVWYTVGHS